MSTLKILIALLSITTFTFASSINTQVVPFSNTFETISLEGALNPESEFILSEQRLIFRAVYNYTEHPFFINNGTALVDNLQTVNTGFGALVQPWLFFSLDVPFHYVRLNPAVAIGESKAWSLGDLKVQTKIRLSKSNSNVHVALMPYISFPSGGNEFFVSDDGVSYGGKFLVDTWLGPLGLFANAGYTYASDARYATLDRRKRIEWAGGLSMDILENQKHIDVFGFNLEASGSVTLPDYEENQNPVDLRTGLRIRKKNAIVFAGLNWNAAGRASQNDLGWYAGMKLAFGGAGENAEITPKESEEINMEELNEEIDVKTEDTTSDSDS